MASSNWTYAAVPFCPSQSNSIAQALNVFHHEMVRVGQYQPMRWALQLRNDSEQTDWYKMQDLLNLREDCSWVGTEKAAEVYVKKVLSNLRVNVSSDSLEEGDSHAGASTPHPHDVRWLHPFISSVNARPDVLVEVELQKEDQTHGPVPILVIQAHSKNYEQTLANLLLSLIDQLRFVRHINTEITECAGFVFPKQREASFVTKINVKWTRNFTFYATLTALKKEEVSDSVIDTATVMLRMVERHHIQYFMPLSQSDLDIFGSGSVQVQSSESVMAFITKFHILEMLTQS